MAYTPLESHVNEERNRREPICSKGFQGRGPRRNQQTWCSSPLWRPRYPHGKLIQSTSSYWRQSFHHLIDLVTRNSVRCPNIDLGSLLVWGFGNGRCLQNNPVTPSRALKAMGKKNCELVSNHLDGTPGSNKGRNTCGVRDTSVVIISSGAGNRSKSTQYIPKGAAGMSDVSYAL